MSSQNPCASGAEAPKEPCDPALQDAVAGLLNLYIEDRDFLNSYSIETCGEKLRELIGYVNDPTRKPKHPSQTFWVRLSFFISAKQSSELERPKKG